MKRIYEVHFNGTNRKDIRLPTAEHLLKMYISGEFAANGHDTRVLIYVNGMKSRYKGFALMNGDATSIEFEESGYYIGRAAGNKDTELSAELTISSFGLSNKIIASGLSTFTGHKTSLLGYQFHSFVAAPGPIATLALDAGKGIFFGKVEIYALAHEWEK